MVKYAVAIYLIKSSLHALKLLSITNLGGNVPCAKAFGSLARKADIGLTGINTGTVRAEVRS